MKKIFERDENNNIGLYDSDGYFIPKKHMKQIDLEEHKLVIELVEEAEKLHNMLKDFRLKSEEKVNALLNKKAGLVKINKYKGNGMLFSFDKKLIVEKRENQKISINPTPVNLAKQKIDQYLEEELSDKSVGLRKLVKSAFKTDSKGNTNARNLLSLGKINIDAPLWNEAVELINEAIGSAGIRDYLYFKKRLENNQEVNISLQFSQLESEEKDE